MAIEKEGNRVYANISDLPSLEDIRDGDSFIVQTSTGTTLLDFKSLLITLDNVSFKSQFEAMWDSYTVSADQLDKIGTTVININNLASDKENLSDAVNQLNTNDLANYNELGTAINTIIKLINANPNSFPNLPDGVTLPLDLLPSKS